MGDIEELIEELRDEVLPWRIAVAARALKALEAERIRAEEAKADARREALEEAARIVETKVWNAQFNMYFYPMGTSLASAIRAALGDAPESGN